MCGFAVFQFIKSNKVDIKKFLNNPHSYLTDKALALDTLNQDKKIQVTKNKFCHLFQF